MGLIKLITAISLVFSRMAFAGPPPDFFERTILNPQVGPGKFIISFNAYEDVRIDSNLDGKIDFWRLRKGNLSFEAYFDRHDLPSRLIYKSLRNSFVTEIQYVRNGNNFILKTVEKRPPREMGYSNRIKFCEDTLSDLQTKIKDVADVTAELDLRKMVPLVDPSCAKLAGRQTVTLAKTLAKTISTKGDLETCMNDKSFTERYAALHKTDGVLKAEIIKASVILQNRQLNKNPEAFKPLLICSPAGESTMKASFSCNEDRTISIKIPKTIPENFVHEEHMEHELLHRIGLTEDKDVKEVLDICKTKTSVEEGLRKFSSEENKSTTIAASESTITASTETLAKNSTADVPTPLAKPATGSQNSGVETNKDASATAPTEKYQGNVKAAETATANIPKTMTIAQTNIPSSESLSEPIYSNHQKTPTGMETAYKKSVGQSTGVFKTANNLMGAMNTQAEAATLAEGKAQVREIASTAQAEKLDTSALTTTSGKTKGLTSRNVVNANETIVEEITLDDTKRPTAASNGNVTANSNKNVSLTPEPAANLQNTTNRSKVAPAGVANTNSGVNPTSDFSTASLGGGTRAIQRQPANAVRGGNARSNDAGNSAREEMITFISHGDYVRTKQRLRDSAFNRQLESQSITILDREGNSYGAKRGELIFLDQGDRFVRQK